MPLEQCGRMMHIHIIQNYYLCRKTIKKIYFFSDFPLKVSILNNVVFLFYFNYCSKWQFVILIALRNCQVKYIISMWLIKMGGKGRRGERILIFLYYKCGEKKRYFVQFSGGDWIKLNMFCKAVRPSNSCFRCFTVPQYICLEFQFQI